MLCPCHPEFGFSVPHVAANGAEFAGRIACVQGMMEGALSKDASPFSEERGHDGV